MNIAIFVKKTAAWMIIAIAVIAHSFTAMAEENALMVEEDFYVAESYTYFGYYYSKVENTGDEPIRIADGILEIYNENDDVLATASYPDTYAKYLQPGEYTYVKAFTTVKDIESTEEIDHYSFSITEKSSSSYASYRLPVECFYEPTAETDSSEKDYMSAVITNNTAEPLFNVGVVLALLDEEGHILYIASYDFYSTVAIMPGNSVMVRLSVDTLLKDSFTAKGYTGATVDAIAYVNVDKNLYEEWMASAGATEPKSEEPETEPAETEPSETVPATKTGGFFSNH